MAKRRARKGSGGVIPWAGRVLWRGVRWCAAHPQPFLLVLVLGAGNSVDLGALLRSLRKEHGVRYLLCEGGPTLYGAMVRAGVDGSTMAAGIGGNIPALFTGIFGAGEALAALDTHSSNGVGAQKLLFVVACPKDVVMYTDAVKTTGNEGKIEVRDLIQLVAEAVGLEMPLEAEPATSHA